MDVKNFKKQEIVEGGDWSSVCHMQKGSGLFLQCGHGCMRLEGRERKCLCNSYIQETEKLECWKSHVHRH